MGAGQGGIPAASAGMTDLARAGVTDLARAGVTELVLRGCGGARFARVWRRWLFGVTEVGWSFVVRVGSCLRRGEGKGVLE